MTPKSLREELDDADKRGELMAAPHVTIARALYRIAAEVAEFNGNFRMIHGIEPEAVNETK